MSKRNLLNLILLTIIVALIAIVIYQPGKNVAPSLPKLTSLNKNEIKQIKITRQSTTPSERELEFKKVDDVWMMIKPYAMTANAFRINSILKILSTPSFSQNSLSGLDLATFGLNKPIMTITFNNNTSLVFGHNKTLRTHRYIKIGSTLHLTTDTFLYQLSAKAESYISHKLLPANKTLVKLSLPNMTLEKINGKWESSINTSSFSAEAINQLIQEWQLSQAYDVNKTVAKIKYKKDIAAYLSDGEIIYFNIEENKSSFNLINLSNRIRYILSSDRKSKLLNLSNINKDNQE